MSHFSLEQAFNLALRHHQAGQLAEAESIYRQILEVRPNHADAVHLNGVVAHQLGRHDQAVELIRRAISLRRNVADYHNNLGEALRARRSTGEAITAYRTAIRLQPDFAAAHANLGIALREKRKLEEAERALRHAIRLQPGFATAHYNLADVLEADRRLPEAIASYREAIRLQPDFDAAYLNLSFALLASAQPEAAVAILQPLLQRQPDHTGALTNLGTAYKDLGFLDDAIAAYRRALVRSPDRADIHSNIVLALHYHAGQDARAIEDERRHWNQQHGHPLTRLAAPHANERSPDRRLRIGYVSPDFRNHVVGDNILPLLERHDHDRFEIFCYAQVSTPDLVTERFRGCADHWRDITMLTDPQVAELVRTDAIDILVDLALHTANNRLLAFARKSAPVQVSFAGYPAGTGLEAIDYHLTDPYLEPPVASSASGADKPYHLSDTFWCYASKATDLAVGPLPAVTHGHLTFGCLNYASKVNAPTLQLWARVLLAVPGSRLLLLIPEGLPRQRALDVLACAGVSPERVSFVDRQPLADYLALYRRIDLGLDTFPYNGHTTSLDSIWMGVPVVTLVGETSVARAGWSQLSNLGLTELAARTPEELVHLASTLARDLPRLAALRAGLRERMQRSPLMDAPRFARAIETAFREMWRRWCAETPVR